MIIVLTCILALNLDEKGFLVKAIVVEVYLRLLGISRHPHHSKSLSGCGNLVPATPHTASGRTLTCASRSVPKRLVVRGFCWLTSLSDLG